MPVAYSGDLIGRAARLGTTIHEQIGTATASTDATIDIVWPGKIYTQVILIVNEALPLAGDREPWLRTSSDGGSTFDTGAGDYGWSLNSVNSDNEINVSVGDGSDGSIVMSETVASNAVGDGANEGWSGYIQILFPTETTYTRILFHATYGAPSGTRNVIGYGARLSTADVNGIRFLFQSDDIVSGSFAAYGVK